MIRADAMLTGTLPFHSTLTRGLAIAQASQPLRRACGQRGELGRRPQTLARAAREYLSFPIAGRGSAIMGAENLTWGQLGCPSKIGLYRFGDVAVRVKQIHIMAAENDPAARFTIVAFRPPLGPAEFMLGHRIA